MPILILVLVLATPHIPTWTWMKTVGSQDHLDVWYQGQMQWPQQVTNNWKGGWGKNWAPKSGTMAGNGGHGKDFK